MYHSGFGHSDQKLSNAAVHLLIAAGVNTRVGINSRNLNFLGINPK